MHIVHMHSYKPHPLYHLLSITVTVFIPLMKTGQVSKCWDKVLIIIDRLVKTWSNKALTTISFSKNLGGPLAPSVAHLFTSCMYMHPWYYENNYGLKSHNFPKSQMPASILASPVLGMLAANFVWMCFNTRTSHTLFWCGCEERSHDIQCGWIGEGEIMVFQ